MTRISLAITVLAISCTTDANEALRVERVDSAGMAVVRTSGPDRALDWHFERILELGGADEGPEAFVRIHPTSIGTDAAGHLYVLDAGEPRVTVFDRDGVALRSFGRSGRGPGEFGFPTDLAVTRDGTIGVYDFALRGLVMFDADGTVLPQRSLPGALQRKFRLAGSYTIGVFRLVGEESDSMRHLLQMIGDADTVTLASRTDPTPQPVDFGCFGASIPRIYAADAAWAAERGVVYFAAGASYAIDVRRDDGRLERWTRDVDLLPGTAELAAAEVGGDSMRFTAGQMRCAVPAVEAAEKIGFLEYAPRVADLSATPGGGVWVRRRTAEPGVLRIDVFDADGAYVGTLPAEAPWPAVFRGPDEIVTIESDSLDLRHIIVYRIERSPS